LSSGSLRAAAEAGTDALTGASAPARVGVCHIASGDRWAGAEAEVRALLKFLTLDPRLELSAIVLNRGRLAEALEHLGIPVRVIPEREKGFLSIVGEAARFLGERHVEVIHSHRYKENLIAAWLARRCRVPHLVRTEHGLPEPFSGYGALKQRLIRGLDGWVARHATDRVIGVSAEMARQLARGRDRQKVVFIPNGVDLEGVRSALTQPEAKQRLGISTAHPVIGTAGRLEPIKRLDIFLRAATAIARERPEAVFVIAGEGREAARLARLAASLGVAGQVRFLGHRDDAHDVLRAFDILLLTSDHEGLPMVLLEAMCLGVLPVARAVGGIPEVIHDGVNGVLVDSGDPAGAGLAAACLEALRDRPRAERLIASGMKSVREEFGAAETARRVAQLYFSLFERA
jgi:L-malate glycosyltransferase